LSGLTITLTPVPKKMPKWKPPAPWKPPAEVRSRARKILRRLEKANPDWGPTLEFSTPFELVVATILAAQAQDTMVNQVTRRLFQKYRGPADYLAVPEEELQQDVHGTGFFRLKARRVRATSEQVLQEFGGQVPGTMDELVRLQGVGRKTASIVLGNAFKVPAIAVDRHVERVAARLRLVGVKGPDGTEFSLRALYQKRDWVKATWCFVLHGRRVCNPAPKCWLCPINDLCPYPKKTRDPNAPKIRRANPRRSRPRPSRSR
jgi:endonuclease-3